MPEELWMEVFLNKKKCKKEKWLSEEALEIAEKRREVKGKGEKERYPVECIIPKISKE